MADVAFDAALARDTATVESPARRALRRLVRRKGALLGLGIIALFVAAAVGGGRLGGGSEAQLASLDAYARALGLAFQVIDDLLDVEGSSDATGKPVGQDAVAGKATFVSILGAERARAQARLLVDQAVAHLDIFDANTELLRQTARFVVERHA